MVMIISHSQRSRYEGKRSNLYAVSRSLSELFASESYTKTRDEEHQSRVFWLLVRCLVMASFSPLLVLTLQLQHAMGGRAAIEEAQVVTFVLEAIQVQHLRNFRAPAPAPASGPSADASSSSAVTSDKVPPLLFTADDIVVSHVG